MENKSFKNSKILLAPCHYVYETGKRGSEFATAYEIGDAIASNWPMSVIVTGKKTIEDKKNYRILEVQPKKTVYNMSFISAIIFTLRYSLASIKILRKENFDVIHHVRPFQLEHTFSLLALLNFTRNRPFVIGSFCSPYEQEIQTSLVLKPLKWVLKLLSTKTLRKSDLILVYDEHTKDLVSKYVSKEKVKVIHPGVNGERFYSPERKYNGRINLISVGYFIPRKQFDVLVKSFNIVAKKRNNVDLTIIGDGPEMEKVRNLVKTLNLEKRVRLTGFIENKYIPNYYKKAHIFVSLQDAESYGQVYLEALASGMPIITSKNVGSRQIVNNKVGILVNYSNLDEVADGIIALVDDKKKLQEMSKNAYSDYLEKYDNTKVSKEYIKAIEYILKKSKGVKVDSKS